MKPFKPFKLTLAILYAMSILLLSVPSLNAQTSVRRRSKTPPEPTAPNPIVSPTPNLIVSPSPSPIISPAPNNSPQSSNDRLPVLIPEPVKPAPINAPTLQKSIEQRGRTDKTQPKSEPTIEPVITNPQLEQNYQDALNDYYSAVRLKNQAVNKTYEYNNWALENRKEALNWQHRSGKIVFGVVLFLVFMGVVFSGIQFYIAMKSDVKKKRVRKVPDAQENEILPTTLKASLSGIEISSSILGVIILVISFLFFYLYLVHVYPIAVLSE